MDTEERFNDIDRLREIQGEMATLAREAQRIGRKLGGFTADRAAAYNAFNVVSSPNPHDVTFEKIVEELEDEC